AHQQHVAAGDPADDHVANRELRRGARVLERALTGQAERARERLRAAHHVALRACDAQRREGVAASEDRAEPAAAIGPVAIADDVRLSEVAEQEPGIVDQAPLLASREAD